MLKNQFRLYKSISRLSNFEIFTALDVTIPYNLAQSVVNNSMILLNLSWNQTILALYLIQQTVCITHILNNIVFMDHHRCSVRKYH